jgi:hypothetical protein
MKKILEENPLVTEAIQKWMVEKLEENVSSVSLTKEMQESFKNYIISIDKLIDILGNNPRSLFDFFDLYEIYILPIMIGGYFSATINGEPLLSEDNFLKRKDAEKQAAEEAFPLLEQILDTDERDEEE